MAKIRFIRRGRARKLFLSGAVRLCYMKGLFNGSDRGSSDFTIIIKISMFPLIRCSSQFCRLKRMPIFYMQEKTSLMLFGNLHVTYGNS